MIDNNTNIINKSVIDSNMYTIVLVTSNQDGMCCTLNYQAILLENTFYELKIL